VPKFEFRLPDIKSVAKVLGIYGAGVVTAGFFLSGPGEYAGSLQGAGAPPSSAYVERFHPLAATLDAPSPQAQPTQSPSAQARAEGDARKPDAERQVRVIPIERQPPETDGFGGERREATRDVASDAEAEPAADAAPPGCNVAACSAQYRSFDARTCMYRAYSGETRRCTR
jgi:hypothetical protein